MPVQLLLSHVRRRHRRASCLHGGGSEIYATVVTIRRSRLVGLGFFCPVLVARITVASTSFDSKPFFERALQSDLLQSMYTLNKCIAWIP